MPRPKPPRISAADHGWPSSSTSAIRIAVAAKREAEEQAVDADARRPHSGAAMVAVVMRAALIRRPIRSRSPSFFFRSSHLVRADSIGRLALLVHSTIEPA